LPMVSNASKRIAAVTPEPQVVITGRRRNHIPACAEERFEDVRRFDFAAAATSAPRQIETAGIWLSAIRGAARRRRHENRPPRAHQESAPNRSRLPSAHRRLRQRLRVEIRGEPARCAVHWALFEAPPFGSPSRQTACEDFYVARVDTRKVHQTRALLACWRNHRRQSAYRRQGRVLPSRWQSRRGWQHMRQTRLHDRRSHRCRKRQRRNMPLKILRLGVAFIGRKQKCASITATSGASRFSASHAVETKNESCGTAVMYLPLISHSVPRQARLAVLRFRKYQLNRASFLYQLN